MHLKALALLGAAVIVAAQRPNDTTICDYYTPALLGEENSSASQQKLMLLITHTFILGNYTTPNVGVKVAGIAAPGVFNGTEVNLLPYFTGGYASSNEGGPHGVVKNFLDDGGPVPLLMNQPANGTSSNQYRLLMHVYQYFGIFFGCSQQGGPGFPGYLGRASQYEVHKYMDLTKYEMGYFIEQTSLAVASLGFYEADVLYVKNALDTLFNRRCSPAAAAIPVSAGPQLQAICVAQDCLLDAHPTCDAYPNKGAVEGPTIVNATLVGNITKADGDATAESAASSVTGSSSSSAAVSPAASTGGAIKIVGNVFAGAGAVLFALAV